jgi:hypothetical protein
MGREKVINLFINSFILTILNQKAPSTPLQGCGALISFVDPSSKPFSVGMYGHIPTYIGIKFNLI